MFKNKIQIAGILDKNEAGMLLEAGTDFIGFPLRLDVHREDIPAESVRRIIRSLNPGPRAVLITYLPQAAEIAGLCRYLGVSVVQLHGAVARQELKKLRKEQPRLRIIKSLVVGRHDFAGLQRQAESFFPLADAFITDTWDAETGASGATGKPHDWDISRRLAALSPKPVWLAGGLTAQNVAAAVACVRPAGVDAHTGVEDAAGRKDPALVERFLVQARRALRSVNE